METFFALLYFAFAAGGVGLSFFHPICGMAVVLGSLSIGACAKWISATKSEGQLAQVVNANAKRLEDLIVEFEQMKSAQAINMRASGLGMPPIVAPFVK